MKYEIHHSDCLSFMRGLPDNHVDAIVTDPPYGLSFMGKKWDYDVPSQEIWSECLRVLKPGGHLLAFAGTRTQHRMAVRIEDAGFEIRDMIAWVYGSGFPKSLDVSKAIDKAAGAEREVVGQTKHKPGIANGTKGHTTVGGTYAQRIPITAPATPAARQWHGWGTALKPALEPITVARKPLIGTVAQNVLTWGTGGVNVDGCRVEAPEGLTNGGNFTEMHAENANGEWGMKPQGRAKPHTLGRWPANLIHDGSEDVVGLFPDVKAGTAIKQNLDGRTYNKHQEWGLRAKAGPDVGYNDSGSAARFFYCAKASKRDRDEGCEGMEAKRTAKLAGSDNDRPDLDPVSERFRTSPSRNHHPTVKPTDLMRYLCRLVTPPGGLVFDPFTGSGSTGKAAVLEGFDFIGCDMTAEYVDIARARIEYALNTKPNTLF